MFPLALQPCPSRFPSTGDCPGRRGPRDYEGGETLEWRSCGCHIIRSVEVQAGWFFEQPDLVKDVSAYSRVVDLMILKVPFQPKSFCDCMSL